MAVIRIYKNYRDPIARQKYLKEYRAKNEIRIKKQQKDYRQSHKSKHNEWNRKKYYTLEGNKNQKARSKLNDRIRRKIIKPKSCEKCGGKAQAHHPDYNKPLKVRWLCTKHHGQEHRKL